MVITLWLCTIIFEQDYNNVVINSVYSLIYRGFFASDLYIMMTRQIVLNEGIKVTLFVNSAVTSIFLWSSITTDISVFIQVKCLIVLVISKSNLTSKFIMFYID